MARWSLANAVRTAFRRRLRSVVRRWRAAARRPRGRRAPTALGPALERLREPLLSTSPEPEQMAVAVLREALRLTGSAWGYVTALDQPSGRSAVLCSCGVPSGQRISAAQRDRRGTVLTVRVAAGGRPAGEIVVARPADAAPGEGLLRTLAAFYGAALERHNALRRAAAALREKEVLVREVHHRVKNNLQVISSLLSLQASRVTDEGALRILAESQGRVRAMALVHEQLHRSGHIDSVDFGEYVKRLAASLFSSYGVDSARISLVIDAGGARLPIDLAVPCGLIVHELVSNALQHAFPGGRPGEIRIVMRRAPAGVPTRFAWTLAVSDNGVGFANGLPAGGSLGLRLVEIFTEQLNGALSVHSDGGAEFRVTFPERPRDEQGDQPL